MVLLIAVSNARLIDVLVERQSEVVTVNVIGEGRVLIIPPPISPLLSPKFNYVLVYTLFWCNPYRILIEMLLLRTITM